MATVEQLVETRLKVIDQATGPLNKVAAHAEKATQALQHVAKSGARGAGAAHGAFAQLGGVLSSLGGLGLIAGAGLSLHSAVSSVEDYFQKIKQVKELTGATASETDFLFSSARRAGVPYATMEKTMFQLSRRGAMLAQTMAAAGDKVPGMEAKFRRLGVTMDKGPVTAMESMAAAVKSGKLSKGDLQAQFRVSQKDANDMHKYLNTFDKAALAAAKAGKGGYIGEETLAAYEAMEEAQHRIADTWNRIKVTVLGRLFPIAAKMAEGLADRLEGALPAIQDAMEWVSKHMDSIVAAAKAFVAVMTAKKVMGVVDNLMGGTGLISGGKALVENIAKAVPMLGKLGVRAGQAAMRGTVANANVLGMGKFLNPAMLASLGGLSASLAILAAVLAAVAVVVGIVYLGFKAFQKNLHGIGDKITLVWDTIKARFELMWEGVSAIGDAIAGLFGEGGGLGDVLGYIAAFSFDAILEGFDFLVHIFQTVASMTGELGDMVAFLWKNVLAAGWKEYVQDPFMESMRAIAKGVSAVVDFFVAQYNRIAGWLGKKATEGGMENPFKDFDLGGLKAPADLFMKHWNRVQVATDKKVAQNRHEREKEKRHKEDTKPPAANNDFRGSRFDIKQNFAEGFDPDRIAVAFSQDLANLGEMRSKSSFTPITAGAF